LYNQTVTTLKQKTSALKKRIPIEANSWNLPQPPNPDLGERKCLRPMNIPIAQFEANEK
jgi:hypothetical protein